MPTRLEKFALAGSISRKGRKSLTESISIYSDKPELRKAVLLSAIIAVLERLIG
jgi:hypothetical protein